MDDRALFDRTFVVTENAVVRVLAFPTARIIRACQAGERFPAHLVRGRAYKGENQWARVLLPSGVKGYVWGGFGTWEDD